MYQAPHFTPAVALWYLLGDAGTVTRLTQTVQYLYAAISVAEIYAVTNVYLKLHLASNTSISVEYDICKILVSACKPARYFLFILWRGLYLCRLLCWTCRPSS